MTKFRLNGCDIGTGHPPYIIAELSGNHNGDIKRAFAIMEAMKNAGVDAIKLQTYTADTITIDHDGPGFVIEGGLWDGRTLYDLYQQAHTPWEWHADLFAKGRELGVSVFSSPFDESAVDFLEDLDCPAYKIASFEAMDLPLVEKVASTGKPLIVSTGMILEDEIKDLVGTARAAGVKDLALLHCVSAYPACVESSNLKSIPALSERFDVVVGLSDHTLGSVVAVTAVGLGAAIIEKHVTLARADGGPDAAFSLEPDEVKSLVEDCKTAALALGHVSLGRQPEAEGNTVFRRSLYAIADIKENDVLGLDNVRSIRPGFGLAPKHLKDVLGRRANCNISRGTPLKMDLFS